MDSGGEVYGSRRMQSALLAAQTGVDELAKSLLEDMRRFGYSREDLERGVADDRFRGLMRLEVERAREHFRRAEALYPLILPESRYCPLLLQRFYTRILDRIERQRYDVLAHRPSLPLHEKLALAGKAWMEKAFTGP